MNFAFDIDGTITAAPEAYQSIMSALMKAGHTVHVLTGTGDAEVTEVHELNRIVQLRACGLDFASHFDYLHIVTSPGNVGQKVQYCLDNNIEFVFEDSEAYTNAMRAAGITVVTHPFG